MNRPSITLCAIMRDEMKHLPEFLKSVRGCFDEIHLTDTGSLDGSLEWAKSPEASEVAECKVVVKTFTWIDDFAAARNYSMDGVTTDFVMWMDLDDRLSSTRNFKRWRDNVMGLADFWLAPYNYAFSDEARKTPVCTFMRERVIRTSKRFKWKFKIHEGMMAEEPVQAQQVTNWTIDHHRTKEDYEKDFSRNVSMLEKMSKAEELPIRLKFYYGKELFDKGRVSEAYVWLDQIADNPSLEHHDRVLTFEYLCRACIHRFHIEQEHKPLPSQDQSLLAKCLAIGLQGATLEPNRAEFYCLAGDALVKMNRAADALPLYGAASRCSKRNTNGFLFVSHAAYEHVPLNQIALIKFQMGDLDGAIEVVTDCFRKFRHVETEQILKRLIETKEKVQLFESPNKVQTDEIVFSCLPGSHPFPFDEHIYATKGTGGSETALIEVAKGIKTLMPNRRVIVFNDREKVDVMPSGVEYRPSNQMHEYFGKFEPEAHFAWRHNVKITSAPTYLWCHDLFTPGGEVHANYRRHICLSNFHKEYAQTIQNIPGGKIHVSRNGINKHRFHDRPKNPNKIVFPSSPDRGLECAIDIVRDARQESGKDLELHVYYGFEHLHKYGPQMAALADRLAQKIKDNPWIRYHGKLDQDTLAKELCEAAIWLYPANFIETYCITALEAMYAKCFPIVREIGALRDTVRPFADRHMAQLIYHRDPYTDDGRKSWVSAVLEAIRHEMWTRIDMDGFDYSWLGVATDFIQMADLKIDPPPPVLSVKAEPRVEASA